MISEKAQFALSKVPAYVWVLLSSFLLIGLSLWNGSPLVYYDTAYYIHHAFGFTLENSLFYRPLTYSLFIHITSGNWSLFSVIFAQSLIICYLLWQTLTFWTTQQQALKYISAFLGLILLTPLAWYSNILIPDVFSATMFLSLALLFFKKDLPKFHIFYLFLIFVFSASTHYSNLLVVSILLVLMFFFIRNDQSLKKRMAISATLIISPWLFVGSIHYFKTNHFMITNTANLFLWSKMLETEVAIDHLSNKCATSDQKLCKVVSEEFQIWDNSEGSVVNQLGGLKNIINDVTQVNNDILTSKRGFAFMQRAMFDGLKQFITFAEAPESTPNDQPLALYLNQFKDQVQSSKLTSYPSWHTFVFNTVIFLSILLCLITVRSFTRQQKQYFISLIGFLVINALVCGAATEVMGRYQGRIIWIIPFIVMVYCIPHMYNKERKTAALKNKS